MKKKSLSTAEDDNESYGEILSRFTNKKLDLRMIMNWSVTSKLYSMRDENEKTRSNHKSDFRNKSQLMSPLKPTNKPLTDVKVCAVDEMRVLRLIPITIIQPQRL